MSEVVRGAEFTDTGNAARLAAIHAGRIRFVPTWNSWFAWDEEEGRWRRDERAIRVTESAKDVGKQLLAEAHADATDGERERLLRWAAQSFSAARIRSMVELARGVDGVPLSPEEVDADPWLFSVRNGVIDLRTGLLREPDPADLITMQAAVAWDKDARAERWELRMGQWFPDPEVRSYVQRLVGAALVGEQRDHVFVIHYGPGGNGKGTFIRALLPVFGDYAVTPHLSLLIAQKHGEHDTVKAQLFRKRLAVASETERRVKLAEASVKNLTGRDRITCRKLYENPWEFTPSHSLWLQTNYLPEIAGRDQGIWRRIRVVPWLTTFERNGTDDIDAELAAEASGILRWAVDGCLAWQREGLKEPEAVVRATMAYRNSEDALTRFAADTGFRFDASLEVPVGELNDALDQWSATEGVRISRRDFAEWLKESGAAKVQRRVANDARVWVWRGAGMSSRTDLSPPSPSLPELFPIHAREGKYGNGSDSSDSDAELEEEYHRLRAGGRGK